MTKFRLRHIILPLLLLANVQLQGQDTYTATDLLSTYYDDEFKPFQKGNWYTGLAFSVVDEKLNNSAGLFEKVLSGSEFNYDVTFKGGYLISDYVQAGLNISIQREKFTGSVALQETDTISRNNVVSSGTFTPALRTYFPLTKNQRLSFFNEVGIGFGWRNRVLRETRNIDLVDKRYTEEFVFNVGISPGITFFAIENFAFEVQLNLVGYQFRLTETTVNDTEEQRDRSHNVNLQINLLTLDLGLAYFFGAKKERR